MNSCIFFFIIFSVGYVLSQCPPPSERSAEAKLREKIFCDYNRTVRPVKDYANATNVYMLLYPMKIFMDHFDETLSVHGHVFYSWRDQYISWNPSDYEGIDFLATSKEEIWVPDLVVDTASAHMGSNRVTNFYSILSSNGDVFGFSLINIVTHCIADLTNFPYDTQNCTFAISSLGYLGKDVNLKLMTPRNGIVLTKYRPNKVWEILDLSSMRMERNFLIKGSENSSYPYITFTFILQRHSSMHQAVTVVPAIGLAAITLLTFFMHSMYYNRITLCSVSIICDLFYLSFLGFWLPSNGDQSPIIITFLRDSLLISILALLVTTLVYHLSSKTNAPGYWITELITKLEFSVFGYIFLYDAAPKEDDTIAIMESQKENKSTIWPQFAFFIDRVSLIACILLFIVLSTFYLP